VIYYYDGTVFAATFIVIAFAITIVIISLVKTKE
jgi:hypothetical protein